jgi:hypothetical protein
MGPNRETVEAEMSAPTTLAPWYVVCKEFGSLDYWQSEYSDALLSDGTPMEFASNKRTALIFHNLASASRVARANAAMIRVLVTEEEAKEFDRA